MNDYERLSELGAEMGLLSETTEDVAFWLRYSLNMALQASVEREREFAEANA